MSHTIEARRLVSMGPGLIRALLAGETASAEALLGDRRPEAWPGLSDVFRMRLGQLEEAPEDEPWLTRAVVLKIESRVIGVTGFHGRPGGAWLRDYATAGLEFGYTIFEGYRRREYAAEASQALIEWATEKHGVQSFVLSMGPTNDASVCLARKLGFRRPESGCIRSVDARSCTCARRTRLLLPTSNGQAPDRAPAELLAD